MVTGDNGFNTNAFVAKISPLGKLVWEASVSGTSSGYAISSAPNDSAIVTGQFSGTAIFGESTLQSTFGERDIFVGKISSTGVWQWAVKAGGGGLDRGISISTQSDGSSVVTGIFSDEGIFGSTSLTSQGSWDLFVAKISSTGVWQWAVGLGAGYQDWGYSVSTLSDGSSFISGQINGFNGQFVGIGPDVISGANSFVAKISSTGVWQWARETASTYSTVTATSDGFALVAGNFFQPVVLGSTTLSTTSNKTDTYVAKISSTGVWQWAVQAGQTGTTGNKESLAIAALPDGSAILTGNFSLRAVFGSTLLEEAGGSDVFVAKISSSGVWQWASKTGLSDGDVGNGVSLFSDGTSVVAGVFGMAAFAIKVMTNGSFA